MDKNIKVFKQSGDTCAICCMLMILEYFNIIDHANKLLENKYYRIYHSHFLNGVPFSAIAWHFVKNDLDVEIVHSFKNYFENKYGLIDDDTFLKSMEEYKSFITLAKEKGLKVKNGIDFDAEEIKKRIKNDELIMLAGNSGTNLHSILISGYENNKFIVCDPLISTKVKYTNEELNNYMNTFIGKWFISIKQKTIFKNN